MHCGSYLSVYFELSLPMWLSLKCGLPAWFVSVMSLCLDSYLIFLFSSMYIRYVTIECFGSFWSMLKSIMTFYLLEICYSICVFDFIYCKKCCLLYEYFMLLFFFLICCILINKNVVHNVVNVLCWGTSGLYIY